jgi:hypothetical protein
MIWYVAIIAILNLGLGYALATMLGANKPQPSLAGDAADFADIGDTE